MSEIQAFLNKSDLEKLLNEPISEIFNKEGSKSGDNLAGQLHALKVLTVSGKTVHLIYKAAPPDSSPAARAYVIGHEIFNVEITMYTEFRSTLETLISSRIGRKMDLPFATYYGGRADGINDHIWLEDLRPAGYVMPDKYKGLNFQQATMALTELAKFHAYTYFLIKHKGEAIFERKNWEQLAKGSLWLNPTNIYMNLGPELRVALEVLDHRNPEMATRIRAVIPGDDDGIWKFGTTAYRRTDTDYFPVICHGDFWANNILFKYENKDETKPISVKFIDLQLCNRGNIFQELQYFFFTSTTPEFRKNHLLSVLDSYYESFTKTLEELKCPRPINFTKGFFIDHLYQSYSSVIGFVLVAIPLQLGRTPEIEQGSGQVEEDDPVVTLCNGLRAQWAISPEALQRMDEVLQELSDLKLL